MENGLDILTSINGCYITDYKKEETYFKGELDGSDMYFYIDAILLSAMFMLLVLWGYSLCGDIHYPQRVVTAIHLVASIVICGYCAFVLWFIRQSVIRIPEYTLQLNNISQEDWYEIQQNFMLTQKCAMKRYKKSASDLWIAIPRWALL